MFKFIKKSITVEEIQKEVDTYECWSVAWKSHYDDYAQNKIIHKVFFTNEEDANTFNKNLVEAGKLLKYTALEIMGVKKEQ